LLRETSATPLPVAMFEPTVEAATSVAAGSGAAVVVSTSVVSLTEGVLKAMLLAKLKGIVLCMGTLAVVASGAAVLAQSGPTPKGGGAPAEPDRTTAMERKLDRILDALERLSGATPSTLSQTTTPNATPPPVGFGVAFAPAGDVAFSHAATTPPSAHVAVAPSFVPLPYAGGVAFSAATPLVNMPQTVPGAVLDPRPAHYQAYPVQAPPAMRPDSDRLRALEDQMVQVQKRLAQVEGRLAELANRVGAPGSPSSGAESRDNQNQQHHAWPRLQPAGQPLSRESSALQQPKNQPLQQAQEKFGP
jgi:hypothetical protein